MKTIYKVNLITLLIVLSFSSCKKDTVVETDKSVILAGEIINSEKYPDDYTVRIIINDFTIPTQRTHIAILNEDGTFKLNFNKNFPQDIYLKYGKQLVTLFVHPGDSLFIQFDADEFVNSNPENRYLLSTIQFSGDATEINQDLSNFLPKLFGTYNTYEKWLELNEIYKTYSPSDFKSYIFALRDEKKKFLDKYISNQNPCNEFVTWANLYIDYRCGQVLHRYRWYKPYLNRTRGTQLDLTEEYYEFHNMFQLNNMSALICSSYKSYLHEYYMYLRTNIKREQKEIFDKKDKFLESKVVLDFLIENVEGFALEFMLSHELFPLLDIYKRMDVFEELYPIYSDYISNDYFRNTLDDKYIELKLKEKNPEKSCFFQQRAQSTETNIDDILSAVIENNKGKVIYIDFWATWCGPCLAEIPYSLKLKNVFKQENVAFVYLCIKSKKEEWENTITDYKIKGDNYLLNDSQYDILSEMFQISGIPHYVLVNNKGEIIDKNAQRPSIEGDINNKLINQIKSLLKE